MKRHIIRAVSAIALAGLSLAACSRDGGAAPEPQSSTIRVNTLAVDGAGATEEDNTFMVLFWRDKAHLETPSADAGADVWTPYLAGHAPQPVAFYERSVFDTRYPYPEGNSTLYATGYSPGTLLQPDPAAGCRRLVATSGGELMSGAQASRCDFLGCDVWSEAWWGDLEHPFAQERNRLWFRHLGAKLLIYADRDRESMESKQFVRNVEVTHLRMSIDGGHTWTEMYTPAEFEWRTLPESYLAEGTSYAGKVKEVQALLGSGAQNTKPKAGYVPVRALPFAGAESDYLLSRNATDRVPIDGMPIDSCYVCNPFDETGAVQIRQPIQLRMDIRAEMSFDPNFPMGDGSSTTDDLTFTREWRNVTLPAINRVSIGDDGKVTVLTDEISEFEPGCEYRIFIHFNRTGVNLVAWRMKWNHGGSHYVVIQSGDRQNEDQTQTTE